jgi:hypothetical protein
MHAKDLKMRMADETKVAVPSVLLACIEGGQSKLDSPSID